MIQLIKYHFTKNRTPTLLSPAKVSDAITLAPLFNGTSVVLAKVLSPAG